MKNEFEERFELPMTPSDPSSRTIVIASAISNAARYSEGVIKLKSVILPSEINKFINWLKEMKKKFEEADK